jgi:Siphovirus Gp157.
MKMKLYELTGMYQELYELEDVELINDMLEALELNEQYETKILSYARVIKQLESDEVALKTEVDRLQAKRNVIKRKVQQLKDNVLASMQATGIKEVKDEIFNVKTRKKPFKVVVDDTAVLPVDLQNVSYTPNKTKIKKYLEEGNMIKGVSLTQEEGLSIK